MKNFCKILLFSPLLSFTVYGAEPQTGSGETDGYKLVWQDLFDDGVLKPERWNIEVNGSGGGNNELQYYTDFEENVRVGDDGQGNGCLILTARREDYKNKSFTSGRVNSMGKIAFTHGKIEASIKLPKTANGLWPAFWMMGNDYSKVGWPKCGETDILEMGNDEGIRNNVQEKFFNGACHWGQGWPNASYAKSSTKTYSLQDGEFHLYTCIWDENSIKMYVDLDKTPRQNPYYSIDITQTDPDDPWSAGNYFHKDNFILFNLAVGGNFTGIHDPANITALNEDNNQEASYYINYVKIYQKGLASEHQDFADAGDFEKVETPNETGDYTIDPSTSEVAAQHPATVEYIVLADEAVAELEKSGAVCTYIGPDPAAERYLWYWENTFSAGDTSYPRVDMEEGEYISVVVGSVGWSGAGVDVQGSGINTMTFNDYTRFHLAYFTPGDNAPASIGIILGDGSLAGSQPAKFAVGADFYDNGDIYPSVGPVASDDWQGIDISFAELKNLCPSFQMVNSEAWKGNIFSFLGGGVQGRTLAFDTVYFYNTDTPQSGIEKVGSEVSGFIVTGKTVNLNQGKGIDLYDLSGRLVKRTEGNVLGLTGLSKGLYVARSGKLVSKVIVR